MRLTQHAPPKRFDLRDGPLGDIALAALEAIVIIDSEQRLMALNPAAEQMFRCTSGQVLGDSLGRFIPAHARSQHLNEVECFMASPATERHMAPQRWLTAMRGDGEEFPVEVVLSRVDPDGIDGSQHYFAVLLRDMGGDAGGVHTPEYLKQRLLTIFALAPIAIWIAENNQVVFANLAAVRLFDSSDGAALIGRSIYELLDPQSHTAVRQQVARVVQGESELAPVQGRISRPDGEVREVEIALAGLPDQGVTTVQMVVADVTQRKREAAEVERSREALRRLSASVVEAREEERRRIARELHDELGQRLTALKMDLCGIAQTDGPGTHTQRIDSMLVMLDETLASVRRIAADLRPMMLDDLGLNAAIEWLARDAARRLGIEVTVRLEKTEPQVDERTATALYRMVQEALTNVARHSHATDVSIELLESATEVVLSVQDNGIGFPPRALQREGSFGLLGIRERASMLGGMLTLDNPTEGGARLAVVVPLAHPAIDSNAWPATALST